MFSFAAFTAMFALACSSSTTAFVGPTPSADGGTSPDEVPAEQKTPPAKPGRDAGTSPGAKADAAPPPSFVEVKIDFDDAPGNARLETRYAKHATFEAEKDGTATAWGTAPTPSKPNFLCAGGCYEGVTVTFAKPVEKLRFRVVGVNDTKAIADVHVYAGATRVKTVPVVGLGSLDKFPLVDLSAISGVTRIEVTNITDFGGIGFDDFEFDFPE